VKKDLGKEDLPWSVKEANIIKMDLTPSSLFELFF